MIEIDENKKYSRKEIAELFHYHITTISSNWNSTKKNLQEKGYLVEKYKITGEPLFYTIKIIPKNQDIYYDDNLPDEEWVTTYCHPDFEVSNKARIRDKITHKAHKHYLNDNGYLTTSIKNKTYRIHSLVLRSFYPKDTYEDYTNKIQQAITEKLQNGYTYDEILNIINNLSNK